MQAKRTKRGITKLFARYGIEESRFREALAGCRRVTFLFHGFSQDGVDFARRTCPDWQGGVILQRDAQIAVPLCGPFDMPPGRAWFAYRTSGGVDWGKLRRVDKARSPERQILAYNNDASLSAKDLGEVKQVADGVEAIVRWVHDFFPDKKIRFLGTSQGATLALIVACRPLPPTFVGAYLHHLASTYPSLLPRHPPPIRFEASYAANHSDSVPQSVLSCFPCRRLKCPDIVVSLSRFDDVVPFELKTLLAEYWGRCALPATCW